MTLQLVPITNRLRHNEASAGFESRQLLNLSPAPLKYTRELFQRLSSFPALNRIII